MIGPPELELRQSCLELRRFLRRMIGPLRNLRRTTPPKLPVHYWCDSGQMTGRNQGAVKRPPQDSSSCSILTAGSRHCTSLLKPTLIIKFVVEMRKRVTA